jgi:hypothetical protein
MGFKKKEIEIKDYLFLASEHNNMYNIKLMVILSLAFHVVFRLRGEGG